MSIRTVLVIEDVELAFDGVRKGLEQDKWHVLRARDEADTGRELELAKREGHRVDVVALDLGLPPHSEDAMKVGPRLAQELRAKYPSLPIMAYTQISPTAEGQDYGLLLARLVPLRVSFVYARRLPNGITLSAILEYVRHGFLIVSPGLSELLHYAVPTKPDPLTTDQWETLKRLGAGQSMQEIANELPTVKIAGVRGRLDTIKDKLRDDGEYDYRPSNEELIHWYREHRARYARA